MPGSVLRVNGANDLQMQDKEIISRAEKQRVTLRSTYAGDGGLRYIVACDGTPYDVSDREFRLLQWGRRPAELGLRPKESGT